MVSLLSVSTVPQERAARPAGHSTQNRFIPHEAHLVAKLGPSSRQESSPAAGHGRLKLRAAEDKKQGTLIATCTDKRSSGHLALAVKADKCHSRLASHI